MLYALLHACIAAMIIIIRAYAGAYLSLKSGVYANNSVIPITEIGETNSTSNTGLQCITDRMPCCLTQPNRAGEWLFPDGSTVPGPQQSPTTFYRNRGDDGTVNLNRLNTGIMMPTGLFCCEVLNSLDNNVTLCTNIGKSTDLYAIRSQYFVIIIISTGMVYNYSLHSEHLVYVCWI